MSDQSRTSILHADTQTGRKIAEGALDSSRSLAGEGGWRDSVIILLIGAAICASALNRQSYWIDEAVTVRKAILPTLPDLWHTLRNEGNANLQVPLYFLFAWGWEKVAGPGELAMRAGNVPWFLLGLFAVTRAFASARRLCWGISAALLASPFAWYYLNEARPYSIQLACSTLVLAASYRILLSEADNPTQSRWVLVLCIGAVLLAASGLFAMLWLGAYGAAIVFSKPLGFSVCLARTHWKSVLVTLGLLLALGIYYLWTRSIGARATEGTMSLSTLLFIPYELLGFSGVGPGRLDLRSQGVVALAAWVPSLACYAIVLCGILIPGIKSVLTSAPSRVIVSWSAAFSLMMAFIVLLTSIVGFRLLGRHCMPLAPLSLAILGLGIRDRLTRGGRLGALSILAFLCFSLYSCSSLRWSQRHAKDDYRSAVILARDALARGQTVWWNADKEGALIYQLRFSELGAETGKAIFIKDPSPGFSNRLVPPNVVMTSRPDKYDVTGAVEKYLVDGGFKVTSSLQAFNIWEKASASTKR